MLVFHTFCSRMWWTNLPHGGQRAFTCTASREVRLRGRGLCQVLRVLSICLSLHPTLPCLQLVSLNTEHTSSRWLVTPVFQLSHMAFLWI